MDKDFIYYPEDNNYDNWKNAGNNIKYICEGIGNYTGTLEKKFDIMFRW